MAHDTDDYSEHEESRGLQENIQIVYPAFAARLSADTDDDRKYDYSDDIVENSGAQYRYAYLSLKFSHLLEHFDRDTYGRCRQNNADEKVLQDMFRTETEEQSRNQKAEPQRHDNAE